MIVGVKVVAIALLEVIGVNWDGVWFLRRLDDFGRDAFMEIYFVMAERSPTSAVIPLPYVHLTGVAGESIISCGVA